MPTSLQSSAGSAKSPFGVGVIHPGGRPGGGASRPNPERGARTTIKRARSTQIRDAARWFTPHEQGNCRSSRKLL